MAGGDIICVIGANGFIRSSMVHSLLEDGYKVHAIVQNLSWLNLCICVICFINLLDKVTLIFNTLV
jgi:nucleoside-diphosphate-sugar epimerase